MGSTSDITLQAPGISNFSIPAPMTFPNVFGAAPGSQLNFLSFDHTTGRLVIEGTATVSEDGLSVSTDPGTGVTHPGWHGLTPPGGCGGSGGPPPPPPPPPSPDEVVTEHDAVALHLHIGDFDFFGFPLFKWNAPPLPPGQDPPPPPPPGCGVPRHRSDPGPEDAFLAVFIQIDGPLARFAEPVVDGLPLSSQAFTFAAGTNEMKRFDFFPQRYDEMFGAGGFQKLIRDQIYGAKIKITEVRQDADGNRTRDIYTYYSYRWVNAIYAPEAKNKAGNSAAFYRTLTSSSILGDSLIRKKFVDHFLPGSVATAFDGPLLGSPFDLTRSVSARGPKSRRPSEPDLAEAPVAAGPISGSGLGVWDFDPFLSGNRTANFDVEADGLKLGSIVARGTATNPTTINVNLAGYKVELKRVILSLKNVWTPQGFGPGSSGDDDGNGSVGNEEYGWPGSDDKIEVVYDYGGAVVTATTPGPDGNLATTADNVERDVLDYRIGGAWRSGGGRTYRWWRVVGPRFKAEFAGYMPSDRTLPGPDGVLGTNDDLFSAAQLAALDTLLNQKAQDLKAAIQADYNPINSRATGYTFVDAGGNVTMVWQDRFSSGSGAPLFGSADFDADDTKLAQLFPNAALPLGGKMWALAENINLNVVNDGGFAIAINVNWTSNISFAAYVANTVSHEIAHTFGINDAYSNVAPTGANTAGCRNRDFNCKPFDIMMSGGASDPDLTFRQQNIRLLQAAMGIQGSFSNELEDAVKQYRDAINLPGGVNGVRENEEDLLFGQMAPPIASNPEIGLLRGDDIFSGSGDESDAVGEVAADGPNGAVITADYAVLNTGFGPLTISTADFADGTKGFSVAQTGLIGTPVAPGETATLRVVFDPAVDAEGKLTDTLVIESDAESTPVFRLPLTGDGLPPHPVALVEIGDTNNLGGVPVSGGTAQIAELAFITNDGTGILMVTDISLVEGLGPFSLLGVPGDLATNPIELARGDSASFGIQFDPNKVGLERALGDVTSNDPDDPMVQISAVGTGLDGIVYPEWGNDYIAIETPLLPGAVVLRELSDDLGNFEVFLPPQEFYHMAVFDPETGLVSHSFGTTARSGRGIDLTSSIFFDGSVAPDADFDGLPDDVEFAIGTTATNPDTDGDGLSDFTEIKLGLDPFGGRAFPTGVIASLALGGQAREVVVEAVTQNGGGQTAYVAAGTQGLAIVDASQFNAPVLLEQIGLPGNAADVAVDTDLGVAAVAAGGAGLHLVDVSNPVFPALLDTVALPNGAVRVEVFDGLAYVASGPALVSIDLVTSELVQTLGLGGGNLTDIAREGTVLHTMDANRNLRAVDISGFEMQARGQLQMPHGGGKLFVGNGIAYAVASNNFFGGFATASVADPDNIILISGSDASSTTVLPKTDIVANGSGLGLLVGTPPRTTAHALNLMSVINSADTAVFLTSFGLPQAPNDVFVASGIAYVADGSAGLQVVNYLPFDNLGQRPEITIVSQLPDLDLGAPGIQVTEGSSIPLQAQVSDDVQVIRVELLVDGEVVATDVSFPFDLSAIALSADPEAPNVQVRARATDMGGNSALSNILDFDLVPDTFAPTVVRVEPANGQVLGRGLGAVRVRFSEPLAAETVTAANFLLRNAAGTVFPPLKVQLRNNDLLVQTTYPPLPVGVYTLFIKASAVTDRAGNPLGVEDVTSRFTLVPTVTYYGYNPNNQGRVTLVGWTDGSIFEVVDLDNQTSVTGGTLDRFESIVVALGGVRHFKVDVTLPVLATLGYDCCNFGGSFFYPAIDGRSLVGREFIVRIPVLNTNNEFIIFAYEDSQVTIRDAAGTVVANRAISGDGFYATTGAPLARRVAYQVESTGNIAIMSNSRNAHTAVPSSNGSDVGSEFLFGTRAWSGYAVAAIFAYTDATVVGTDLVSGLTAFERTLAAGDFAYISGLAESKFRVMSTGNIGVWAGSTEGGNAIQSMGDDLTMNTGNVGLEFVIHTQSQGAHLFAFRAGTSVDIGGTISVLDEDEFIDLAPGAFHRISSDKPIIIETIGGNGLNDWETALRLVFMDEAGEAPTVSITAPSSGDDVVEGSIISIDVEATDDIAVASVELLVDGTGVSTDFSSPFRFDIEVPIGATNVTLGARAIDLGGNVGLAQDVVVNVIPDTFPPNVVGFTPAEGEEVATGARAVQVRFDEPLAPGIITGDNFRLLNSTGDEIPLQNIDAVDNVRTVRLTYPPLPADTYRIVIDASEVTDRFGNPLGVEDVVGQFVVVDATVYWLNGSGFWDVPANWSTGVLPGPGDEVFIGVSGNITVTHRQGSTSIASLRSGEHLVISGGTLTLNQASQVEDLTLSGGVLTGPAELTIPGSTLNWTGGRMEGTGRTDISLGAVMNISGNVVLRNRTINNSGTVNWIGASGEIQSGVGAVFNNLAGGIFDVQNNRVFDYDQGGTVTVFNNAGIFRKSTGDGTTTIDVAFNNTGTADAQAGTLSFTRGFTQTAGATVLSGGGLVSTTTLDIQGGSLSGSGTVTGDVSSAGQVGPGSSSGILNINGNYTQVTGDLNIEIGGLTTGDEFDQLNISSLATLAGTLNISLINGFGPTLGNTFVILTYGSLVGTFDTINGLDIGGGLVFQVTYGTTSLTLEVVSP